MTSLLKFDINATGTALEGDKLEKIIPMNPNANQGIVILLFSALPSGFAFFRPANASAFRSCHPEILRLSGGPFR